MTLKKVITLGGATQDIFIQSEDAGIQHLHPGAKIEVSSLHYASGGGATNTAVAFKRLGCEVTTFFKIGHDAAGQAIINQLKENSITTDQVAYSPKTNTGTSFIIPAPAGDRIIFAYRGANAEITPAELPLHAVATADCVYITSLAGNSARVLSSITKAAKESSLVAVNPGKNQLANPTVLLEALSSIDIFIVNSSEARTFMQSLNLKTDKHELVQELTNYFKTILQRGPRIAVVTNGAGGVYVATKQAIYFCPSVHDTIINTVGAGDAFGSCFVASLLQELPIEQAIINGVINSASVLSHPDAKTGLLDWDTIQKRARSIAATQLQIF